MTTPASDIVIGNFSRRTVLTGAGWTRNWGGRLAVELWQDLTGCKAVQSNPRLCDLLKQEPSFEIALSKVQSDPFTHEDRRTFQMVLLDAFIAMDREVARLDSDHGINIYKVQELLFRFFGQPGQGFDTGYMFTLNQDLWPERYLYNEHVSGAAGGSLPGIQRLPNQGLFTGDLGAYSQEFVMNPAVDPKTHGSLRQRFNIIKLHGSFNWRTTAGRDEMIVGTGKTKQIATSPLLSWYWDIFRRVLSAGGVRLLIAGYGFGDEHVNAAIACAIQRYDLRVFIWDVRSDLRERVVAMPHGKAIWQGLLSTSTRSLMEVFPSGDHTETGESRRIRETLFGR